MNACITLKMCVLLLFLSLSSTLITQATPDETKRRSLFLECWEEYMRNYIIAFNVKLNPTSDTPAIEQWNTKFKEFKETLRKIKPIYDRWKQYNIPINPMTTYGGGNWLSVFLGIKPRYESVDPVNEERFIKEEVSNIPWIKFYLFENKDPSIETMNKFFETSFIKQSIKNPTEHVKENELAIYLGLTPEIFELWRDSGGEIATVEEKNIKAKKFTIDSTKLSNSCSLLIPGIAIISYQTPYTILYGRLIQYALVYLESIGRYKRILLIKMHRVYEDDSWLKRDYPDFYAHPLKYDAIYQMYEKKREENKLGTENEDTTRLPIWGDTQKKKPSYAKENLGSILTQKLLPWTFGVTVISVGIYAFLKYVMPNRK